MKKERKRENNMDDKKIKDATEVKTKNNVIGMDIAMDIGESRGKIIASLNILNGLVNDSDFDIPVDLLVEKFGFTREQILNGM